MTRVKEPAKPGRSRINLEVPERVRQRIEHLQEMTDADGITDVIRRAIDVYAAILTASREEGRKVIIRDRDGTERELLIV